MITIIKEKGRGKTTCLIKESNKLSTPILTIDNKSREYIKKLASQMDVQIIEPITIHEIKHGKTRGLSYTNNNVLVDDVDHIVSRYLAFNHLQMVGFSINETKPINEDI